ncbi:hypothetical protein [Desulfosediminicola flagellatus]|uniref:hypothetical protein n=1 Tax=Desulfosediminicola flagellatus TaxID=2569541 RepID=UPI0010AC2C61|nr:hypothetical protein [Desulfosediminicola flagellatus]
MIIENKYELIALHRCLLEAKFSANPDDLDIVASPIAAKIANQVIEELSVIEGEKWLEWRQAENHPKKLTNLKKSLLGRDFKLIKSYEQKKDFMIDALAPLLAGEELLNSLITEVFDNIKF